MCVFSQYGEIVHINLIRDHKTGKSKGFGFICYEDQRSTVLAVDNLNGMKLLGRLVRVDHVHTYKLPKDLEKMDADRKKLFLEGCAPKAIEPVVSVKSEEEEDDLLAYESVKKKKKKKEKKKRKKKKHKRDRSSDSSSSDSTEEEVVKKKKTDDKVRRTLSQEDKRGRKMSNSPVRQDNRSRSRERSCSRPRDLDQRSRDRRRSSSRDRFSRYQTHKTSYSPVVPSKNRRERRSRSRDQSRKRSRSNDRRRSRSRDRKMPRDHRNRSRS